MTEIRKGLLLMRETINRFPSCDDCIVATPFRLDFGKEKSKDKGKRKVDLEEERHRKVKCIEIAGSCPKCGMKKHTRKICPKYLVSSQKGIPFTLYLESCFVVDSTDSWIVDFGATNHVCNSLQWF